MIDTVGRWVVSYQKEGNKRALEKGDCDMSKLTTPEMVNTFQESQATQEAVTVLHSLKTQVSQTKFVLVRDMIMTSVLLTNANRSGVLANISLDQVQNVRKMEGVAIISVTEHKTASYLGPAKVVLSEEVYGWLCHYLTVQVQVARDDRAQNGEQPDLQGCPVVLEESWIGRGDNQHTNEKVSCLPDGHVYRESRRGSVDAGRPQTDGNSTSVLRSARLAVRNAESPCIALWSISKILGVLFSRNIQAPLGASHEELLDFLMANVPDIATSPATGIPASTPPAPRKASSKRKYCAPPATSSAEASAPEKRARSQSQGVIPQQTEDPILTALSYIQTSLLDMDARILNLENSPSSTRFIVNEPGMGTSSAATYNANPAPSNLAIEPRRNMGTAIPAAPVGVPFFPPAAAISAHLRAQILAVLGGGIVLTEEGWVVLQCKLMALGWGDGLVHSGPGPVGIAVRSSEEWRPEEDVTPSFLLPADGALPQCYRHHQSMPRHTWRTRRRDNTFITLGNRNTPLPQPVDKEVSPDERGDTMLSLHQLSLAGAAFLFTALLHARGAQSASVRQHRLRSGEAEGRALNPIFTPNYDMVKALEYIESLRQQTGREEDLAEDYDYDDAAAAAAAVDRSPYLSRLAQLQSQNPERGDTADWQDHRTQQWLKALLRNLQKQAGSQPGEAPGGAPAAASGSRHAQKNRQHGVQEDSPAASEIVDYGGNPKPHKKYPLMFEDETSEERPYKRANEHAEEQYTPQSLATLQSVFEELGKLSASKNQKRESRDEEQKFYRGDDDDDDLYRLRSLAYEDVTGGEDWTPIEENVETEEEVKDSQEMFDRGLDEDLKRSTSPMYGDKEDQDDINRLVDYYLLKILEKTERTEEKRDRDQERRAEKRLQRPSYSVDPMAFYQLMEISRKLQIPPEDLIEMVRNGEIKKQDRTHDAEAEPEGADDLEPDEGPAFYNKDNSPASKFYGRRMPDRLANDIPDDLNTEDILNILGLESLNNQNAKYLLKQSQPKNTPSRYPVASGRRGNYFPSKPKVSDKRGDDYDNTVDEDELATFLAAKMLAQYPEVMNKAEQRRSSQRNAQEPFAYGIPEQLIKDYIDQIDSEKTTAVKRQTATEEVDDSTQTQQLDDVTLPDTTTLQKPEAEMKEEKEVNGKTLGGMSVFIVVGSVLSCQAHAGLPSLTSCSMSDASMERLTDCLEVSCTSPPMRNSSRMKSFQWRKLQERGLRESTMAVMSRTIFFFSRSGKGVNHRWSLSFPWRLNRSRKRICGPGQTDRPFKPRIMNGFEEASAHFVDSDLDVSVAGRSFMITGANSGIGKATAVAIAKKGGTIHMVCRNWERAEKAKEDIYRETGNKEVYVHLLDMSETQKVWEFAESFKKRYRTLNVLIHNACRMTSQREVSTEGFEKNFATNTLGKDPGVYILTKSLLPLLERNSNPRVVSTPKLPFHCTPVPTSAKVSVLVIATRCSDQFYLTTITVSSGDMLIQKLRTTDLQSEMGYFDANMVYAQNKRQQVVMTEKWAKAHSSVHFSSTHPGWADTPAVAMAMPQFYRLMQGKLRAPEQGADTVVWLAVSDAAMATPSGLFFQDRQPVPAHLPLAWTHSAPEEEQDFMIQLDEMAKSFQLPPVTRFALVKPLSEQFVVKPTLPF
ncbi:hypothetical protein SKAU_G00156260 [Synaphobranchus kaupii]|uniref:Uncharacterized protein n=1 Tax=Synaphobranchus kaupii TaxID=118154 RepID=A0A9Q1IYE1_SYNKA|nr:hypothetical protein SKAU_G00156260 [Synaphobranchus kaupii]